MSLRVQGRLFGALLAVGFAMSACGKSEPPQQKPVAQEPPSPPAGGATASPGGAAEEHAPGTDVVPGTSTAQIWTQIDAEQAKLAGVIQSGDLEKVHHLAFGVRDLAVALGGKLPGLSAADAAKLQQTLDAIKKSASELDENGDSGNLTGVKAEYVRFQEELRALQALPGSR